MAIFKRGRVYWYNFIFDGERIQRSTKQGNKDIARNIAATHRTRLAKGEAGIEERETVPSLSAFKERFLDEIRVRRADHPETIDFYSSKYSGLLRYAPLSQARLNRIDEKLIAEFTAKMIRDKYERSTVNRHLATLKRALRLAARWRIIDRVPSIQMLSGENQRDFVLSREKQIAYFDVCPEFGPTMSPRRAGVNESQSLWSLVSLRRTDSQNYRLQMCNVSLGLRQVFESFPNCLV